MARGLLDDNNEWHDALREAAQWASGPQLRNLFCSMLMFSEISEPEKLWEQHWEDLNDDLERTAQIQHRDPDYHMSADERKNLGLYELDLILNKNGRSLKDYPAMPLPSIELRQRTSNRLIREYLDFDASEEAKTFDNMFRTLNVDQLEIFRAIIMAHEREEGGVFFVYGSGGTGKTHLWKTIMSCFRSKGLITLSVASSGIAALLLPLGKTAHSLFKIPIELDENSVCNISKNSDTAQLLRQASLIIWDEAPMSHRYAFEALDRTLQDICDDNRLFGGKLVVLGSDFRQILPVVSKGGRKDVVAAALCRTAFWNRCRIMNLKVNMRLMDSGLGSNAREKLSHFADWILNVGNGAVQGYYLLGSGEPHWIEIPDTLLIKNDMHGLDNLINFVYPNLRNRYIDEHFLEERCILAPTNNDVEELNMRLLAALPGDSRTYLSSNTYRPVINDDYVDDINPSEVLHGLTFPGFPSHKLELKVGAPIVLLRNIDTSCGLCNGTRLIIRRLGNRVIEATILTGRNIGQTVAIPRIDLTPSSKDVPFFLKRRQFSVKLAFAMTINKSQGQTLKRVGVYLPKPVFSHGQLYVAISRVTSPDGLKILLQNRNDLPVNMTKNVIYKEIFNDVNV